MSGLGKPLKQTFNERASELERRSFAAFLPLAEHLEMANSTADSDAGFDEIWMAVWFEG